MHAHDMKSSWRSRRRAWSVSAEDRRLAVAPDREMKRLGVRFGDRTGA
jgi:hypothetical protein